jgi:outer membrane protein OmpA-like peptidoglycan-associated protein
MIFINMIKQTWNIDGEEKVRILNLHESATKNLYLLKEQDDELEIQKNIPKNVSFSFPLKSVNKAAVLDARTDDNGNVSVQWENEWHKIPTIQDIGLPKFWPNDNYALDGVDEWEWINTFNRYINKAFQPDLGVYIPAYDKFEYSLHFLRYGLVNIRKPKDRIAAEDFIQADDNKFVEAAKNYYIVKGSDIPIGSRVPMNVPITPPEILKKETPIELNISNPFKFDDVTLTPEGQSKFDKFVENLKNYLKYYSGNVEVITSSSIDADPKTKESYNLKLSQRRAESIINELKNKLGQTTLNFVAKPIGQTEQFAPGLKWPEVKDQNKTAPNRRLIIKLPKISIPQE